MTLVITPLATLAKRFSSKLTLYDFNHQMGLDGFHSLQYQIVLGSYLNRQSVGSSINNCWYHDGGLFFGWISRPILNQCLRKQCITFGFWLNYSIWMQKSSPFTIIITLDRNVSNNRIRPFCLGKTLNRSIIITETSSKLLHETYIGATCIVVVENMTKSLATHKRFFNKLNETF